MSKRIMMSRACQEGRHDKCPLADCECSECGCHAETTTNIHLIAAPKLIQDGWLCPRCDVIVAPMYRRCEGCGPQALAKEVVE